MQFLDCTFERQGDPNPKFPAGHAHYVREGDLILLCPARYANANSYTDLKKKAKKKMCSKWQNVLKSLKIIR